MAKKPTKASKGVKPDANLLPQIVAATKAAGFMYVEPKAVEQFAVDGLIELNVGMKDGDGNVAARATEYGINFLRNNTFVDNAETIKEDTEMKHETVNVEKAEFAFEIDSDVPAPTRTHGRSAGRKFTYPFELLQVGQSFHIPTTTNCPQPHKSRAGTVSLANSRYAIESGEVETVEVNAYAVDAKGKRLKNENGGFVRTGVKTVSRPVKTYTRRFSIYPVDASDKRGAGARVFRTA